MPIEHKTFTKIVTKNSQEALSNAFAEIDHEVAEYLKPQHWSQSRDSFQTVTPVEDSVLISRTIVYTTEQLAFAPGSNQRPPV